MGWKSRIVGEGEEAPDQLLANPANWRIHPREQQEALTRILDRVGWVQRVIVNRRTGHVVDGHLRVALAISRGEPSIPVIYVDVDEDEERLLVAALDPLSALAVTDDEKLLELLRSIKDEETELVTLVADQNKLYVGGYPSEQDWLEMFAEREREAEVDIQPYYRFTFTVLPDEAELVRQALSRFAGNRNQKFMEMVRLCLSLSPDQ